MIPEKVLNALRWLKTNNPLYADIDIIDEWLEEAMSNDKDLFAGMVEQSDTNDMNGDTKSEPVLLTQEPVGECNADNMHESGKTNQPNCSQSMECFSTSTPDGNDVFTGAFNALERVARENGFVIYYVPYGGNCLFSFIAYQLESITVCSVDKCKLRQKVADHLKDNPTLLCTNAFYLSL